MEPSPGHVVDEAGSWTYAPPPSQTATDLARGDFWARLARPLLSLALRMLVATVFRRQVEGRAAIPRRGPFVLVANHASHLDAAALMSVIPLRRVNDTHPLAAGVTSARAG